MFHGIYIGSAGWNISALFATQFPSTGSHLQRYARVLPCCEINSSFYRPHKKQTWEKWANSVPDNFRFSVKAPKAITHEAGLNCKPKDLADFIEQIKSLGDRRGSVLFQLPPSLAFDRGLAKTFFTMLRDVYFENVVFEPRHKSWFAQEAEDLFEDFCIARAAADPACLPQAALPGDSGDVVYFRLHGSPRKYYSSYDSEFLNSLAGTLLRLSGTAATWCIFDNTASGAALGNALELMENIRTAARSQPVIISNE